jgi:large subunit ribosomal protein L22
VDIMPTWKYSVTGLDPEKAAIASGRELPISPKAAREICACIKGLSLEAAKKLLEEVINLKRPIPYKRYFKKVPHRHELSGWPAGRYPTKAAKYILKVLKNVEANAENKGLDTSRLYIIHAASHRGFKIRKYIPRAFGRSTPFFHVLTHIEVAVEER